MQEALTNALIVVVTFVPKLIGFLLVLLIGWIIAKVLADAIAALLERVGFDKAVERGEVGPGCDAAERRVRPL